MSSPLGPTLANPVMCQFEFVVGKLPSSFQTNCLRQFFNDTFLLFPLKNLVEKFKNYLNKQHKNIKFTLEIEKNGRCHFWI